MKKVLKSSIALCLCLLLFSVSVMAQEGVSDIICEEYNPCNVTQSLGPRLDLKVGLSGTQASAGEKALALREFVTERLTNIENHKSELSLNGNMLDVDMSKFNTFTLTGNDKSIIEKAMNDMFMKNPELFWCYGKYVVYYGSKLVKIGFTLNCGEGFSTSVGLNGVIKKINSLTQEFDDYVKSVAELIPDSYSDYEKILFVNDYICANFKYDTGLKIKDAYLFFKEGKGVCQSYTLAFLAIMDELGIRCDAVVSEGMNHTWNLVELNGKWYHIDVTWNDPIIDSDCEDDTFGSAYHKYFLLSTQCMKDYNHNHYDFEVESYGYTIGTEYDNISVDPDYSLKSSFVELNGVWYNTGYNSSKYTCGLFAFDSPDISKISDNDFKGTPVYEIEAWDYMGSFSYLVKYNDAIIFNTTDSIYMFDGKNITKLCVPENEYDETIYGFDIKDNTLRIQLANTPNSSDMMYATLETFDLTDLINDSVSIKNYDKTADKATVYSSLNKDATLIFASFDKNNRMIDCKPKVCSGATKLTSGTRKYSAPDGFNTNGAKEIRIMLLDNMNALRPLCGSLKK